MKSIKISKIDSSARPILAEAGGTAFLLATVVGSGIMGEMLANGNAAIALLANSLATGAILYVLITMLGPISGAHFNPAVTLALWLDAGVSGRRALAYAAAQVAGAVLGVWLAHLMFDLPVLQASDTARNSSGQWISEAVATFGLVAAILTCLRHRLQSVGAVVGCYIGAAYWFTASTSFANPAVTFARAWTDTFAGILPHDMPVFMLCQIAGAALAWRLVRFLFDGRS